MKYLKKICLLLIIICTAAAVFAQDAKPVEMADAMRSNGKIYIVVAVCLTILTGLFLYVFMIDRKIAAFEKSSKD
jgi:dolichyl-phosphate-mannose--protein O-mannosyl transferase